MALYSFIQSLNTTFGTSIFEPVAVTLARTRFLNAQAQYVAGNTISETAQRVIQDIVNELSTGKDTNKKNEIQRIRDVCQHGKMNTLRTVKIDVFVENHEGAFFCFDLKTAKPNISNFKSLNEPYWNGVPSF
jgi:type II restriction enzyme